MQNSAAALPETNWQVEVGGQIYEASFNELTEWIAEGSLQPHDKVRRGNLRWLEAGKIPSLHNFFNAKQAGQPISPIAVSTSEPENKTVQNENSISLNQSEDSQNLVSVKKAEKLDNDVVVLAETTKKSISTDENFCHLHPSEKASFVCAACAKSFCRTCPKSFGNVKVCPACGELCKAVAEVHNSHNKNIRYAQDLSANFGFTDFGKALKYPFRFTFSLISGALLFAFFTLGQSAWALGGMFLIVAAIFCWMLANTLTFGILANTIENFSHGKTSVNFMPPFDDFNLWDDVIHPFFLSIATYLVSFGVLVIVLLGGIYFAWSSVSSKNDSANLMQTAANINSVKTPDAQSKTDGALNVEDLQASQQAEAKKIEQLETQLKQAQEQSQKDAPGDDSPQTEKIFSSVSKIGKLFLVAGFLALLWGLFYFPAACAVAGYTRSFSATLNPLTGLDTIKRLGIDYAKILLFSLIILVGIIGVNVLLSQILSPFNLPQLGNIPVKAIGSLFAFYFSTVFSVTLGYGLYKNSDKLNLKPQ